VGHWSCVNARFTGATVAEMMDRPSQFSLGIGNQVKGVVKTE